MGNSLSARSHSTGMTGDQHMVVALFVRNLCSVWVDEFSIYKCLCHEGGNSYPNLGTIGTKLDDSKNALKIFVLISFILFFGWILVDFFFWWETIFQLKENSAIQKSREVQKPYTKFHKKTRKKKQHNKRNQIPTI